MENAETNDHSVLLMFDPLTSPLKSAITRETPRRRRELDPTSPVAAFFSSVDKSKNLLATVRKQKQADLIDLGQVQSPLRAIHEHVEQQATGEATASVLATPLPTFRVTMEEAKGPPIDPFSPATYATTSSNQFFPPVHQLNLRRDPAERNTLVFLETPAKTDLLVSTNFTPVPANLPSLLNASLSSLRQSGTESVTSTGRRRRSSIDLDQELQAKSPDSSFDILRGELEIGNSADVSFVSTAEDPLKLVENAGGDGVGESPWTIRTTAPSSGFQRGSGLLPVEEVRETSLLAHEIPLPDSCPTSPESSTGHNEDANMNAAKVFSHLRRFSMANPSNGTLRFPAAEEPSPPRSPSKKTLYNTNTARKPVVHVRTTSTSSISSISSSRSGVTLKGSPSKRVGGAQGTPKSPSKMTSTPTSPSKAGVVGGLGSAKRLPRPSIAAKPPTSTTTITKPRMSVMPGPRASLAPTRKTVNAVGTGAPRASIVARPRASMVPPSTGATTLSSTSNAAGATGSVKRAPRASVQPAPRPSISRIGLNLKQPLRAPRASVVRSTSSTNLAGRNPVPTPVTTAVVSDKPTTPVLAPSVRANSTVTPRISRPSLIGGVGGLTKRTSVSTALNSGKVATVKETEPVKTLARPRPRTSSAGAALISRPELELELERDRARAMGVPRPVSVAARLIRPKSSLRV